MRALVIVGVLVFAPAVASAQGAAARVDIDLKQASLDYVLRILGDTARLNVVILEGADTKVDVQVKRTPWTTVLDDVIKRANLAYVKEGNVVLVGPPAFIDERKKAKKRTYAGPAVDVDLVGVDATDAGKLLSAASPKPIRLEGGSKAVTLRLMRLPLDQAQELILLATGATVAAPPAKEPAPKETKPATKATKACAAARMPAGDLEAIGVVRFGTKRWALLGTKTSAETFVVAQTDCVGTEAIKVKQIGTSFVQLADDKTWQLHPAP